MEQILGGGLLVAPSGPGLANDLVEDACYSEALRGADVVLPDSGLMVLLWKLIRGRGSRRLKRVSGLEFMDLFLRHPNLRERLDQTFWVMPSEKEKNGNLQWLLHEHQLRVSEDASCVAPLYSTKGPVQDEALLGVIRERCPSIIFLNIGGGVQERVGYYLKQNLDPCPAIICCGAAIAFLAGGQVRIPQWADRLKLGWFLRCCHNPRNFIPRYWRAMSLISLLLRYREKRPDLRQASGDSSDED